MGQRRTSTSNDSSSTLRDEAHVVNGEDVNVKKVEKTVGPRRRSKQKKVQKRKKPGNHRSNASNDEYYLRWNPSGDYDSDDDDWWNEVMALERKDHHNEKKKEKKDEQSMYRRYKYHTRKVMEWGNSFWLQDNAHDNPLPLRTMIGRLNALALRGIDMPPTIHRNLELAIELREEFQVRYVSQRKRKGESEEIQMATTRRNDFITTEASAMASPWPRNVSINKTNTNNEIDQVGGESSKNPLNETSKYNIVNNDKRSNHRWILDQLKELLKRFGNDSDSEKIDSDNRSCAHSIISIEAEAPKDSQSSCSNRSHQALTKSLSPEIENCTKRNANGERCNESLVFDPGNEDDAAKSVLSTCTSSHSNHVPSHLNDTNQCNDRSSGWNSSSSSDNWDKLFGDDGSRIESIGSNESCDCFSQKRDLDIALSIATDHQIDESQTMLNPEISQLCVRVENENADLRTTILGDQLSTLSDPSNNSIRRYSQTHINLENPSVQNKELLSKDEKITDDMDQEEKKGQVHENENDGIVATERAPTSNNVAVSGANETRSERLDHPKQYDSVWDISFLENERVSVLENANVTSVQKDVISLSNSEPPEDWEMLLEDEEDTIVEESASTTCISREATEYTPGAAQSSRKLAVNEIELPHRESNCTACKHPDQNHRKNSSDRVFAKLQKSPYAMKENLRYDSVWDIFTKDKTESTRYAQLAENHAITKSPTSIIVQAVQPEHDWEALYF